MLRSQLATLGLVAVTVYVSWLALQRPRLFELLLFDLSRVRAGERYRLLASGFVHIDWMHLLFNMLGLYLFGRLLEAGFGCWSVSGTHLAGILGGNLLALWYYRHAREYRAGGASGGVSAVVFAAIFLYPDLRLQLFLLPVPMPGWVYALGYIALSMYAARRNNDVIGHVAHMGGALAGAIFALAVDPARVLENVPAFAGVIALLLTFLAFDYLSRRSHD